MARKKARIRRKVVVGHDADGKAVVKWVGGYTVKEVEAKNKNLYAHIYSVQVKHNAMCLCLCTCRNGMMLIRKAK